MDQTESDNEEIDVDDEDEDEDEGEEEIEEEDEEAEEQDIDQPVGKVNGIDSMLYDANRRSLQSSPGMIWQTNMNLREDIAEFQL